MAIVKRIEKGSELTHLELDGNFTDLDTRVSSLEASDANDISLTSLSVTSNPAGVAALSYDNATGVFTYTPPDLTSFSSALNNVVEDTSPELGGDLVTGTNRLKFSSSGGSMLDFTVTQYSVANNTVLSSVGSINLFLDSASADSSGDTAFRIFDTTDPDGTVTEANNIFKVADTGDVSIKGKLKFPDGSVNASYAGFGANDDLKIFHNGNHSIVRETGTGSLYLQSNDNVILSKDSDTALMVKGIADGAVELYHNAVKKFETTATGIEVFGDITADAFQGSLFGDDSTVIVDAVNSAVTAKLISVNGTEPTSSGDAGEVGEVRFSDNYIYIKTAGAGWKRANLSGIA